MSRKDDSPVPLVILSVASLVTVVIVVGFIVLFSIKGVSDLRLNEIGDSLAGPAGTLAFVWLLVTVLLQRHEMTSLKGAAEMQASSLEISAKISLRTHLRDLQERYAGDLRAINNDAKSDFLAILVKLNFLLHPEEIARKPKHAAWWLTAYFLDAKRHPFDLDSSLLNIKSHQLKKSFDYDAYLTVQTMLLQSSRVCEILSIMRAFAKESGTQKEQRVFERVLEIDWFESTYPMLFNIHNEAIKVIKKGGIANKLVTQWMHALDDEKVMSVPWSDDWLSPIK